MLSAKRKAALIVTEAARVGEISPLEIYRYNRTEQVAYFRHIVAYLLRKSGFSWQQCAFHLGRKNHTTIMNSYKVVEKNWPEYEEVIGQIMDAIKERLVAV